MELSYESLNLETETRMAVIQKAQNRFGMEERDGEFVIPIKDEQFGDALYSFVQGILHISDVEYLKKERVRLAFKEDLKDLLKTIAPVESIHLGYYDPVLDPRRAAIPSTA